MLYKYLYCFKLLLIFKPLIVLVIISLLGYYFIKCKYDYHLFNKKRCLSRYQRKKKLLNYLYISNIMFELPDLMLLIMPSIGFIIILRIFNLGKNLDIFILDLKAISFFNIIIIIIVVFILCLNMRMIYIMLNYKGYKLYLYFIHFSICLKIFEYIKTNFMHSTSLAHKFYFFFDKILSANENDLKYVFPDIFYSHYLLLYLRKKIRDNYLLLCVIHLLKMIATKWFYYELFEETLKKYYPQILIYISLVYDLKQQEIKLLYYTLFIYSLIIMTRTIRKTIGEYDMHEIDYKLVQYFYKEKIHAKILKANVEEYTAIIYSNPHAEQLYVNYEEKLKEYIEREYRVDYIDINFKKSYEPYNMRLLLIAIGVLYINFCYHSSLINNIIISIPLVIAIVIYEISYKYYKTIKYNRYFLVSYIILIIISIMGFIWIYLTRHNFNFIRETIWSMGIIIEQSFTLTEKRDFLVKYLFFIINKDTILTIEQKLYIYEMLKNINVFQYITESTTMEQIKEYCNNLTKTTDQLLNWQFSKKKTILESVDIKELYNIIKDEQIQKNILNKAFTHIREYFNFDNEAKITIGGFIAFIIYRLFVNRNKSYLEDVLLIEYPKRTSLDIINFILKFIRELFH